MLAVGVRDGGVVASGGGGGMAVEGGKMEPKHAMTASVDSGVAMAENERPEREVEVPEIVVSTPHGSREQAGRHHGVGTGLGHRGG